MRASVAVPEWLDSSRIESDTGEVNIGSACEDTLDIRGTATVVMVAAGRVHASGASMRFVAESNAPVRFPERHWQCSSTASISKALP